MFLLTILFSLIFSACHKENIQSNSRQPSRDSGAIILRFADSGPSIHPSAGASEYFARLVETQTEGKIKIKVYFDGELGNDDEVLEQLRFGGIALGRVSFDALKEAVPALNDVYASVVNKPQMCRQAIIDKKDFITDASLAEKLFPLSVFYPDKRCFYTDSRRYFTSSLRNFQGLKVGTLASDLIQNQLKKYGAIPVNILSADTYQSMQKGFMNLREGDLSDFILGKDYYFAKYLMISDYIANPPVLVMSSEVLNQLSFEQRKILLKCADQAAVFQQKALDRFYTANMTTVKNNKKVVTLRKD